MTMLETAPDISAQSEPNSREIPPYQVLFIGPYGFSGSTLVDLALAQAPEACTTGEIFQLGRWLREDNLCTCRQKVSACSFWPPLLAGATLEEASRLYGPPAILDPRDDFRSTALPDTAPWRRYSEAHWALFDRIAEETGARLIIDSSKHLWRLRALALLRPRRLQALLLVRNPAVVARSAQVSKARPAQEGAAATPAVPYPKTLLKWILTNRATARFVARAGIDHRYLAYERFAAAPEAELPPVAQWLGLSYDAAMARPATAGHHNIAGSRWRMEKDFAEITPSADLARLSTLERGLAWACGRLAGVP